MHCAAFVAGLNLAAGRFPMDELHDLDLVSADFHADPSATLAAIRSIGKPLVPVRLPIIGKLRLCVTYDACSALLKDHDLFVRNPANAGIRTQERILMFLPRSIGAIALNMLAQDDPDHRRLRSLVDTAFQRRGIEAIRPAIAQITDELLDRLPAGGEVDLMEHFCRDLPLSVISMMLGVPETDHMRFKRWMGGLRDTANIWAVVRAVPGVLKVVGYLRRLSRPGSEAHPDGLVAALREAEIDGGRLSEDEMIAMIFLLFGAGQETTTHLIAGGLAEILRNDDQRRRLQADTALMPLCVEECLRQVAPVQITKPRWAARDGEFAGETICRGDGFVALLAAANRDPAKFDNPDLFDVGRRPNQHLGFGTGVHFCLGFQLARAEAAIAFERILARFPDMRLAVDPADLKWRRRLGIRALERLPVVLR